MGTHHARTLGLVVSLVLALAGLDCGGIRAAGATANAPTFDPVGAHLGGITLRLAALGRGDRLAALDPIAPTNDGAQVIFAHGAATEWYVRQAGGGVEQGVTLAAPPPGEGPLTLTVATPEAIPLVDADGSGASLLVPHGGQWRYDGLRVTDAAGRNLSARLHGTTGGMTITVEDAGAVYPLVVDPFVYAQTLAVSGTSNFGVAVALSGDGSTALVGAYTTNSNAGTAYVFTRGPGGYSQFGPTLAVSGTIVFGGAVALSADGNTVLVGADGTNSNAGTAYAFTRGASGYSQFGPTLAVSGTSLFGYRVALSADGSTALVGAYTTNSNAGTAYVFTGGTGGYSQFGPTLAVSGTTNFGSAVALSGDGSTAIVGAFGTNSNAGTAYVFTRSGSNYTQFGPTLAVSGTIFFGYAVALSADGSTALVGAYGTNAAYLYTRGASGYTQSGPTLAVSGTGSFGIAVALSGDGNTALVGAYSTNGNAGTAYAFVNPASVSALSGDHQSAVLGQSFAAPLTVVVTDANGFPLPGITVSFAATTGANLPTASLSSATAVTNSYGVARVSATAAGRPGVFTVTASVAGATTASFTLTNTPAPTTVTLTGFSPPSGPTTGGTVVTLTGTNFGGATSVNVGGVAATNITVVNSTTITATTPAAASAGTVDLSVTTNGQTAAVHGFTYVGSGSVAAQPGSHPQAGGGTVMGRAVPQPQRHEDAGSGGGSGGSGGGGAGPNAMPPTPPPAPQPARH